MNTAWSYNLAKHVEPRLVSRGSTAALMAIAGLIGTALAFVIGGAW